MKTRLRRDSISALGTRCTPRHRCQDLSFVLIIESPENPSGFLLYTNVRNNVEKIDRSCTSYSLWNCHW